MAWRNTSPITRDPADHMSIPQFPFAFCNSHIQAPVYVYDLSTTCLRPVSDRATDTTTISATSNYSPASHAGLDRALDPILEEASTIAVEYLHESCTTCVARLFTCIASVPGSLVQTDLQRRVPGSLIRIDLQKRVPGYFDATLLNLTGRPTKLMPSTLPLAGKSS